MSFSAKLLLPNKVASTDLLYENGRRLPNCRTQTTDNSSNDGSHSITNIVACDVECYFLEPRLAAKAMSYIYYEKRDTLFHFHHKQTYMSGLKVRGAAGACINRSVQPY